jgi:uncharacterized membrane protein
VSGKDSRPRPLRTALLVLVSTVVVVVLTVIAPAWLRVPAVVLWVLLVPGLPWAVRMELEDRGDTVAVAVAISMALATVVGGGMAALGTWSPLAAVLVLVLAALCALVPGPPVRRHHDLQENHR